MPVTHHRGLSVTESGYMVGPKLFEVPLLPTNNFSGYAGLSPGMQSFDGGTFVAGSSYNVISTRLSSIITVVATPGTSASGYRGVSFSGWAIGFTGATQGSGTINWLAIG